MQNIGLPMSRGAQIANVLSQFYQTLREKEAKKKERAQGMESLMLRYNLGQQEAEQEFGRQKELLGMKAGQEKALKEWELQNPSELEKERVEDMRFQRSETMQELKQRLQDEMDKNEFLRRQSAYDEWNAEVKKQNIIDKYSGKGIPTAGTDDFNDLVKEFQDRSKYLQSAIETYDARIDRNKDDEVSKKARLRAQQDLEINENKLSYLMKNDPLNPLFAGMPQEAPQVKEEKPGFLGGRGIGNWLEKNVISELRPGGAGREMFKRQEPMTPKAGGETEPVRPQGLSRFAMYYRSPEGWKGKEAELDYLMRYVVAHPEDKKAMRKFQELKAAGLYND